MKLIDQVCTLEQAQKLNDLGIVQGLSVFFYDTWMADKNKLQFNSGHQSGDGYNNAESCFSAFTVAELGVMITSDMIINWPIAVGYDNKKWHLFYTKNKYRDIHKSKYEAIVRAEMLIYLLEKGLTTVEKINQRLTQ
jgi:hypothetical protein